METPEAGKSDNLDMAVDTLGGVLRDLGKYAFDIPQQEARLFGELCERWAAHALFAAMPPNNVPPAVSGGLRDWAGLRAFVADHRRLEQEYVTGSLSGMQEVIWTFIHDLNRSLVGDQAADQRILMHLDRLREAVAQNSLETLQREVFATVASVTLILDERQQQQRLQIEELYARIRELDDQLEEARLAGAVDPLTLVYNRKTFDEQMRRALELNKVFGEPVCLMLIDADRFKAINDTYGHAAGDAVLRALADCLSLTFPRRSDCVARYGGEEFAVVLRDAERKEAIRMAERMMKAVHALEVEFEGTTLRLTVSAGVAEAGLEDTTTTWLQRADRALYAAKQQGRDRCVFDLYHSGPEERVA